jgi:hypothetical protein
VRARDGRGSEDGDVPVQAVGHDFRYGCPVVAGGVEVGLACVPALQRRRKSQGRTSRSPAQASIALVVRIVLVAVHSPVGKWAWGGAIWQVPGLCGVAASTGVCVVPAVVRIPQGRAYQRARGPLTKKLSVARRQPACSCWAERLLKNRVYRLAACGLYNMGLA